MPIFLDSAPASGGRLAGSAPAQVSHTGDLNETTMATINIGAGHGLTTGSRIIISQLWSATNNANAKTIKVKIGATAFTSVSILSIATGQIDRIIMLRSLTSQVSWPSNNSTTYSTTSGTVQTGSEDVSGAFTISITATLGVNTDTISLEYVCVRFEIL